jgi:hypothetical protein
MFTLLKTGNQRAVVRVFIAPHTITAKDRLTRKNGVTNFQYFLHREFGEFTARKLLD